jgi:predicted deacylase
MNRLWPGRPDGRVPEKIAHAILTEAASFADFAIDLHCHDHWNSEVVILEACHEPSLAFGRALGCRVNHRSHGAPNMFAGFMAGRGVPAAAIELVPIYLVSQASVARGVRMLKNALRYARMLPGEPEMPEVTYEFGYDAEKPVLSQATGMVSFLRASGDVAQAGDLLAEVFDPWSFRLLQGVVAPYDCLVSRAAWNSYTQSGWPLCKVVDLKVAQARTWPPSPPARERGLERKPSRLPVSRSGSPGAISPLTSPKDAL